MTSKGVAETNATNAYDVLILKAVSPPIPAAQTISGAMEWVLGVSESNAAANSQYHIHAFVTQGDSDNVRGTLYTDYTESAGTNEWPTTAAGKKSLNRVVVTDVTASAGDRIVIEIGYVNYNTSTTSYTSTVWYGGSANGDLMDAGDETTYTGYFEFSGLDWSAGLNQIYRSVGVAASALCIGTSGGGNGLDISGSTATFSNDLSNSVGVGDAIQYDSDNNSSIDAICFIHGRSSATSYTVKSASGGTPTSTSASDQDWSIFRAYASLNKSESGDENDLINDGVEAFEAWSGGRDLISNDEQWNIACYGDGADTTAVLFDGWTTSFNHYIKIYTPTDTSEVGTSQRHSGTYAASGVYRLAPADGPLLKNDNNVSYLWIDGLIVEGTSCTGSCEVINLNGNLLGGYYRVSNNIVKIPGSTAGSWQQGHCSCSPGIFKIWNNIFYDIDPGDSTSAAFWFETATATSYVYNNLAHNSGIGFLANGGTVIMINNISNDNTDAYSGTFATGSKYNISDQSDAPGNNAKNTTSVTFVNEAGDDFHLDSADTAAGDAGFDLSADLTITVNTDIDAESRTMGTGMDIGPDEITVATRRVFMISAANVVRFLANAGFADQNATSFIRHYFQPDWRKKQYRQEEMGNVN